MTIQFEPNRNLVRIGDKCFPAISFDVNEEMIESGIAIGYKIPLGESSSYLSIAIGVGTYGDNYSLRYPTRVELNQEMQRVEVGFDFAGNRGFDVIGHISDSALLEMIQRAMSGDDPF